MSSLPLAANQQKIKWVLPTLRLTLLEFSADGTEMSQLPAGD